jgi:parallel beta-helix repeat protein
MIEIPKLKEEKKMDPKKTIIVVSTIALIALVVSVVKGTSTASTSDPNTLSLVAGWNLVGFDVTSPTTTPDNLFSGQTYYIWKWSAENKKYVSPSSSAPVELGVGYWISVGYAQTVTLPAYPHQSASYVVAAYNSIDNANADFMCTGTDDQNTINNAINSLPASGGSIYLREGTYILSDDIIISKSNVSIVGAGASTVLKIKDSKNADMYVIFSSANVNLLIQNLRIDGNRANQTAGYMRGIYFVSVENSKIVDCWVENLTESAVFLDIYSNNNTVTGNTCTGTSDDGIALGGSSNNTVTGNTCTGNDCGTWLAGSDNNIISGNTCTGNNWDGIFLYSSSNNTVTGNTCTGNNGDGIHLESSSNNTVTGNTYQGNREGILLSRSSNNTVTGNTCTGNGSNGIRLYLSSNNNTISGNTVVGNSQEGNNTYDGIHIDNDCDYNNIQGNTVRMGAGLNQQRFGVRINTADCDNNLVINNDFNQAGASGDISDAGTGTITAGNRISNGTLSGQVRSATIVVAASNSKDKAQVDYVCDGVDDQNEINAAINSLPDNGGSVYLAEGTYILSDNIVISKSNVAIVGAGASTVLKIKDNKNADMSVIYAWGKVNLLIQNLHINGNRANQTTGYMNGIYFDSVENSKIVDCWVENLRSHYGILLVHSSNNKVTGNTCTGIGYSDIYLGWSNYNTVTGNTCMGNSNNGIELYSSSNNTVTGNTCQNNWVGIYLLYYSDNNTVTGNTCTGGAYGIFISLSNNNTVTGNTYQRNSDGILLSGSSNNTVTGNTCTGNGSNGIRLYLSSNNNTISGNTVVGNSQASNNTYDGIHIENDCDYNNIQGNTVRSGTGANQQRYGIRIDDSYCDGNLVINNDLNQAGVTADYSDAGTGTIYHNNRTSAGWVA